MLATAFILGLAGSLHCAGMCSPLAFAVTQWRKSVFINRLLYNVGRIFTYGVLGGVVSLIGVALPLEDFQTGLSIGMGAILILVGLVGVSQFQIPLFHKSANALTNFIKSRFSFLVQRKGTGALILLGALNGLLPCGLTAIALASCIISPTVLDGFYFMLAFGAGTLPVMIGFVSFMNFLSGRFNFSYYRVNTVMLILAGCVLIGRGFFVEPHREIVSGGEIEICR
jgi:uncharacterized protein